MKLSVFVLTLSLVVSVQGFVSNFPKPKPNLGTRAIKPKKKPKPTKISPKVVPQSKIKVVAKKTPPKVAPKKKVVAKKTLPKVAPKKVVAKKTLPKVAPKKKVVAKKTLPKVAPKKKVVAKKTLPKVAPKKKVVAKKAKTTAPKVIARKPQPLPKTIDVLELPGILPPVGFFDPLNFAAQANDNLILKYREAELTHGRVAMVAFLGFLFGELASGYNGILNCEVTGYAIGQIDQVPGSFWASFWVAAFAVETARNQNAVVDPVTTPRNSLKFGTYNPNTLPGDIGFDPLGLKPSDPEELKIMQTKELQHGRVAMIASSGFLAQELVDKKGIVEHVVDSVASFLN